MKTFKEQYDKLTEAYIHNKVDPYYNCACFVGNLLGRNAMWGCIRQYKTGGKSKLSPDNSYYKDAEMCIAKHSDNTYTPKEILQMENLFLQTLEMSTVGDLNDRWRADDCVRIHPKYEEGLFKAFSATLDLLKQIHESKGEKVDEFTFSKRQLTVTQ